MRGNSHVRFLEGLGARKSPWPTRRGRVEGEVGVQEASPWIQTRVWIQKA
jgi:hypothetical protein